MYEAYPTTAILDRYVHPHLFGNLSFHSHPPTTIAYYPSSTHSGKGGSCAAA